MLYLYILKVEFYIIAMPMGVLDCWVPIVGLSNLWGAYQTSIYFDLLSATLIGPSYKKLWNLGHSPKYKFAFPKNNYSNMDASLWSIYISYESQLCDKSVELLGTYWGRHWNLGSMFGIHFRASNPKNPNPNPLPPSHKTICCDQL